MSNNIIKLGDYCDVVKGAIGIKKAIPGDYPLVVTAQERLSHTEYQFDKKAVIVPLVSSTGHGHASIKRLHYQEGKFALGTILAAIIIKDETIINPRFLYIYLSYFKDHLLVPLMKGAANVTLSISKINSVEIVLPSIVRQLEIIELERNNSKVTDLINEIQIQKDLVLKLKQSILQEAIQGKLTESWRRENPNVEHASELLKRIKAEKEQLIKDKKIKKEKALPPISEDEIPYELPEGWVWCRLGEICSKTGSGSTPRGGKSAYVGNGVKFIRSQNVYDDGLRLNNIVYVSDSTHEKMMGTKVNAKDLLLNITGGSIGRCCMVDITFDTGNINQHVAIIRTVFSFLGDYLHKVICSPYFQNMIFNVQTGAGREGLPKNKMDNILIALPPIEEQALLVKRVQIISENCTSLEKEVVNSEENAKKIMQSVLKEAFN
ncbi:hypothetical protein E0494_05285 [Marinilabiliaceae bacterium JC040]|nr:hypothetical protein [Marinilabiliaceae bacterium JC040]